MNPFALVFLIVNSIALLSLSRKWAPLPLLIGVCYMTLESSFQIGPFNFTIMRALIAVGYIRALIRGEKPAGGMKAIDVLALLWGSWCILSALFHNNVGDTLIFRLGKTFNIVGFYFLIRTFCANRESAEFLCKAIAILVVPIACEMLSEHFTNRNMFAFLGGVGESPQIRDGKLRAQGPFGHAILAGTVGAACLPLMLGIWKSQRFIATLGAAACITMVFASVSSGPIMTLMVACCGAFLWLRRGWTRWLRWMFVALYIAAEIVMERPAYFLISKIDLTGSSTAYFRSQLIQSSIDHLSEWWFAGTDFTRHWMPTGVSWSPDHTDITNQYLAYGVWGGLPLMFLFIGMLVCAFIYAGRVANSPTVHPFERFLIWMLGASLFSHCVTFLSVAYFDQSYVFIYIALGAIASIYATGLQAAPKPLETPSRAAAPS
ncbi:MAG: hypothetical protein JWM32_568 [Verrucomicrobia bacterium]|nr:hypothetical protein [Verrucomicrobiota bacterium]